jgi:heme exporter protein C
MSETTVESTVDRVARRAVVPTAVLTGLLAAAWAWYVVAAPLDSVQGIVQKILYVHPPMAFSAYAGFVVTAIGGALYLWRRDAQWDRLAAAAAEVGVLFGALMIATGPIWAKATWGKWWSWDLRLTLTLLLFLVYLSYLLLRSFTEGSEQVARFSAVYAIAGLAIIPLNYFAIELAGGRSIHPENVERSSFGEGMGLPFLLGVLTALAAFLHLLARRVVIAGLATEVAEREAREGGTAWHT